MENTPPQSQEKKMNENSDTSIERGALVEEIHSRFHKDLIRFAKSLLKSRRIPELILSAEDVVSLLYKKILTEKEPVNLQFADEQIKSFLFNALLLIIINYPEIRKTQKRIPFTKIESIDTVIDTNKGGKERKIIDLLRSPENEKLDTFKLEEALKQLKEERPLLYSTIYKRFFEEKTQPQIGEEEDITKQAVSLREKEAIKNLKKILSRLG
jgi:RNA polymerase sigma factor (sigma-70 family)